MSFDLDLEPGANRVGLHLVPVLVNYWQEIASWGANMLSARRVRKAPIENFVYQVDWFRAGLVLGVAGLLTVVSLARRQERPCASACSGHVQFT